MSILEEARRKQIELGTWFETPLHPLPLDQHRLIGYELGTCPTAESTAFGVINLPLHERVTSGEAERIVDFVISHAAPA
jgi:dTDP-4-amino-4,6-dideoxygalactose transaminase